MSLLQTLGQAVHSFLMPSGTTAPGTLPTATAATKGLITVLVTSGAVKAVLDYLPTVAATFPPPWSVLAVALIHAAVLFYNQYAGGPPTATP